MRREEPPAAQGYERGASCSANFMIIVHNGAQRPRIRDHCGPVARAGFGFVGPAATGAAKGAIFPPVWRVGVPGLATWRPGAMATPQQGLPLLTAMAPYWRSGDLTSLLLLPLLALHRCYCTHAIMD